MAPGLPRTSFNTSGLVRLLAELAVADVGESKQSFAERLGSWLDLGDAISLSAALKPGGTTVPSGDPAAAGAPLQEELARLRAALVDSISSDEGSRNGRARLKLPTPAPGASVDAAADFSPYHRYYLAQQRDMEAGIGPLRAKVRAALPGLSPALGQLAALDAVLEEALAARERNLFASVPLLLGKRFDHLRRTHQAALADSPAPDDAQRWTEPGGWLAVFCRDLRNLLLAELELRLQPVAGLIEAIGNKVTSHP